jgi:hypothetical protein
MASIQIEVDQNFIDAVAVALANLSQSQNSGVASAVSQPAPVAVPQQPAQQPADPWASHTAVAPPNGAVAVPAMAPSVPVAPAPVAPQYSPQQPAQQAAPQGAVPPAPGTYPVLNEKTKLTQTYVVGAPSAPNCDHGFPAAYVSGVNAKGRAYNAWRCAMQVSNWKQKCTFNQWA